MASAVCAMGGLPNVSHLLSRVASSSKYLVGYRGKPGIPSEKSLVKGGASGSLGDSRWKAALNRLEGGCLVTKESNLARRKLLLQSTVGFVAGVVPICLQNDAAVASEFADMPALRGKDYGKPKMRYPDYTETPSGLQYKDCRTYVQEKVPLLKWGKQWWLIGMATQLDTMAVSLKPAIKQREVLLRVMTKTSSNLRLDHNRLYLLLKKLLWVWLQVVSGGSLYPQNWDIQTMILTNLVPDQQPFRDKEH